MKQNVLRFIWAMVLSVAGISWTLAQTIVTGQIVDNDSNLPIVGASVTTGQGATLKGTSTNVDGFFKLEVPRNATLSIRSIGYQTYVHKLANTGKEVALGVIRLKEDAVSLGQVEVIASIVPKDRKVPVPVSNISLAQIESKAFNTEFPELLKSTPSVYVTRSGGGFGDSRIMMRGFDTNNLGVLINGVPINDMESGKVYWSNWAGLTDVSSLVQVQRGLGASRLGISSVGGTINIVTKNIDAKKGGSVYMGLGNDQYMKYGFNVSTGLMDNGWALTASGNTSYGDGYIMGTNYRAWNYFLNVSKKINNAHTLSFSAFGAPQWHNQRSARHTQDQYAQHPDGTRMNLEYGYLNGKVYTPRYNYYHKPQLSLNHYWTINSNSSLSTAVYASMAKGGGRGIDGKTGKDADGNSFYYTNWIEAYRGKLNKIAMRTPGGLIDWESVFQKNSEAGDKGSNVILTNSVNNHNWFGLLSTYRNRLDENFTLTAGLDGRYYRGDHYKEVADLLGGKNYQNKILTSQKEAGKTALSVGDKVDYHNLGEVVWGGAFAQGEFTSEHFDAFLSGSLTYEGYRYLVPDGYEVNKKLDAVIRDMKASNRVNFMPFSVKAGASYKFLDYNNFFFNAGYFTRAPHFAGTFLNYSAEINKHLTNEKIFTAELGYGFTNEYVRINLNGYYTKWNDRFLRRSSVLEPSKKYFNFRGLNAQHAGVELDVEARPVDQLRLNAMVSWGDWRWGGKTQYDVFDDSQNNVGKGEIDLNGVHVGNSAQFTAAFNFDWEVFPKLHLRGNVNYYGKNYADFEPTNRLSKNKSGEIEVFTGDAWKMPDYTLVDLSASYNFELYKGTHATIFGGVNNLFNKQYIADATDGVKVDANNKRTGEDALVWYGFGRTWQMGMRINF